MNFNYNPKVFAFFSERFIEEEQTLDPYAGFNVTPYTGDSPFHVERCQKRMTEYLHIPRHQLIIPHQVHGTRCLVVTKDIIDTLSSFGSNPSVQQPPLLEGYDAVVTQLPEVCVCISTADCVPILFFDTRTGAVGAVHAGWRGTVARIAVLTLCTMYETFGTRPQDVLCTIGPSIGPSVYEVGEDVYRAFSSANFPMSHISVNKYTSAHQQTKRWLLNLWEANAWQLRKAGLLESNISVTGICTYTNVNRYFSARKLGVNSGRIISGIIRHK